MKCEIRYKNKPLKRRTVKGHPVLVRLSGEITVHPKGLSGFSSILETMELLKADENISHIEWIDKATKTEPEGGYMLVRGVFFI